MVELTTVRILRVFTDGTPGRVVFDGDYGRTDPMRIDSYAPGRGMNGQLWAKLLAIHRPIILIGPHHTAGAVHTSDGRVRYAVLDLQGTTREYGRSLYELLDYGWDRLVSGPETPAEAQVSAEVLAEEEGARVVPERVDAYEARRAA